MQYANLFFRFFFLKKGTPEFVTATDCVHYFEWRTTAACKKDVFKANKEVTRALQGYMLVQYILGPLGFEVLTPTFWGRNLIVVFKLHLSRDTM